MKYRNGDLYEGQFFNDAFQGKGTLNLNNGFSFKGIWKNGVPWGKGKEQWSDETVYEGEYLNG